LRPDCSSAVRTALGNKPRDSFDQAAAQDEETLVQIAQRIIEERNSIR
jgi:hypothetical protein